MMPIMKLPPTTTSKTITNASADTPIVITTSTNHGFTTGDYVVIGGVGGNAGANGSFYITVLSAGTFSLNDSHPNGDYTAGGTATKIDPPPPDDGKDKVIKETTTTTGTGNLVLLGPVSGFYPMAIAGDQNGVQYGIDDGSGKTEYGLGYYDAATNALVRLTVESSSGGNDPDFGDYNDSNSYGFVNFGAGTKTITAYIWPG